MTAVAHILLELPALHQLLNVNLEVSALVSVVSVVPMERAVLVLRPMFASSIHRARLLEHIGMKLVYF